MLEEIQQSLIERDSDLGTILRKFKIYASTLGSNPLEKWLIWESNGYPQDADFPDYRIWPLQVKGDFCGYGGARMENAPVPTACIPKNARNAYANYKCGMSISSVEHALEINTNGIITVSTSDLSLSLGMNVWQGYNCVRSWAEFSIAHIHELHNSVRNRLLDFSIELGREQGRASSSSPNIVPPNTINQIFHTHVYSGTANITGYSENTSYVANIIHGDISSLKAALAEVGVERQDLIELESAINEDETPTSPEIFGSNVSNWVGNMVRKAATGAWNVGVGAAGGILAQCIAKFYGL